MRFSSNFGTAIHTLLIIEKQSKVKKVTSEVIAEILDTSPVLLRLLLGKLKKAGLVSIAPRKEKAGTTLLRPLEEITLLDVFEAVEPNYIQELHNPSTRIGNRCHSGIYTNEIICEYINIVLEVIQIEFSKTTLADTLTALEIKEAECPYDNPSALFPKTEDTT